MFQVKPAHRSLLAACLLPALPALAQMNMSDQSMPAPVMEMKGQTLPPVAVAESADVVQAEGGTVKSVWRRGGPV
jgi:hypothetical protein